MNTISKAAFKRWCGLLSLLPLFVMAAVREPIHSSSPVWQGPAFFIVTRGMAVADILRDFGSNYRIPMVISEQVDDRFIGTLRHAKPEQLLHQLAHLYNLVWYYDGEAIYVYKTHEFTTKLITPDFLSAEQLQRSLQQAGVLNEYNCHLKVVQDFNAFELFGVPVCIQRVGHLVKELDSRAHQQALNREAVTLFPLQYASAEDMTYHYRQQQVVVPGVVSVLKAMSDSQGLGANEAEILEKTVAGQSAQGDSNQPKFSADPRQNAVIVRDREISMPIYRRLIADLDKPQLPIEISLVIIDVNVGQLEQLGLDWSLSSGQQNRLQLKQGLDLPAGGHEFFSSVLSNAERFMMQINALQRNAQAKVLSQPSIVTLNNVQAVLDKSVTFYTKLTGAKVAQLASVTSGTLLRVTPRVVTDPQNQPQKILLQLNIQDGRQQSSSNSQEPLPQVQNAEIATQATLKVGQSLLLGGFVQDSTANMEHKVPLLGDLPGLGRLFRNTRQETQSVVRLFLIKAIPIDSGETEGV
ncbi:MAG: EscC/YscC/HrcC family type III secretion system outer membrane ring protein [Candidatus Symbiodolus clandestinus]